MSVNVKALCFLLIVYFSLFHIVCAQDVKDTVPKTQNEDSIPSI
jgi:hypothetical protein